MSDLIGNPEDRFSRVMAQIIQLGFSDITTLHFDKESHHKTKVKYVLNNNNNNNNTDFIVVDLFQSFNK